MFAEDVAQFDFNIYQNRCKVCSFWSCAFLALCFNDQTCARESTFFIFLRSSNFEQWPLFKFLDLLFESEVLGYNGGILL